MRSPYSLLELNYSARSLKLRGEVQRPLPQKHHKPTFTASWCFTPQGHRSKSASVPLAIHPKTSQGDKVDETEGTWTEDCLLSTSLKTGFSFVTSLQFEMHLNTFHELLLLNKIHERSASKPARSLIFLRSPEFATLHLLDNGNCQNGENKLLRDLQNACWAFILTT